MPEELEIGKRYRYRESSPGIKRLGIFALEVTTEVVSIAVDDDHYTITVNLIDDNVESGQIAAKISDTGYAFLDEKSPDEGYFLVSMDGFEQQLALVVSDSEA